MKVNLLRVATTGEEYTYDSYDMSRDIAEMELRAVQDAIANKVDTGVVIRSWAVLSGVVGVYLSE